MEITPQDKETFLRLVEKEIAYLDGLRQSLTGTKAAITVSLYGEQLASSGEVKVTAGPVSANDITGLPVRDAIREIAKRNGGEFRPSEGRKVLVAAGLIKSSRSCGNRLHQLLVEMIEMEHVRRNLWRLVEPISLNPDDAEHVIQEGDDWADRVRTPITTAAELDKILGMPPTN